MGVVPSGNDANTSGWTVGWAILLGGALAGATFGGIQRLVRRRLPHPHFKGWVRVSTAGFGAALAAAWGLGGGRYGEAAHHALPHGVDVAGLTWPVFLRAQAAAVLASAPAIGRALGCRDAPITVNSGQAASGGASSEAGGGPTRRG